MKDSIIEIKNLNIEFSSENQKVVALEKINLNINKNEFICIMGVSGCGKTTLLNALAGFIQPTNGKILLKGNEIQGPGPDRAVVFQDDAVFPWLSVEDNIAYSHKIKSTYGDKEKELVKNYINLVGLEDFKKAWPRQLSGGMRKRVDLARAFAAEPELLLMDEPFGALDIMTKEKLQEELRKFWVERPRTIVFITHDVEEAVFLGDKVIVMTPRPGRIDLIIEPNLSKNRDMSIKSDSVFFDNVKKIRQRIKDH